MIGWISDFLVQAGWRVWKQEGNRVFACWCVQSRAIHQTWNEHNPGMHAHCRWLLKITKEIQGKSNLARTDHSQLRHRPGMHLNTKAHPIRYWHIHMWYKTRDYELTYYQLHCVMMYSCCDFDRLTSMHTAVLGNVYVVWLLLLLFAATNAVSQMMAQIPPPFRNNSSGAYVNRLPLGPQHFPEDFFQVWETSKSLVIHETQDLKLPMYSSMYLSTHPANFRKCWLLAFVVFQIIIPGEITLHVRGCFVTLQSSCSCQTW